MGGVTLTFRDLSKVSYGIGVLLISVLVVSQDLNILGNGFF